MTIRFDELRPVFVRYEERADETVVHHRVENIDDAQGVRFLCPKCFAANGGPAGTHMVTCWSRSRGTPDDAVPGPGRWALAGTGFHDLSLNADPPATASSVELLSGCKWHGHVKNGEVTIL